MRWMRGGALVSVLLLVAACTSVVSAPSGGSASGPPAGGATTAPPMPPPTVTVEAPTAMSRIASDQPCLTGLGEPAAVTEVGIAPHELEAMLLDRASLGVSASWMRDPWLSAYLHNVEVVTFISSVPAGACEDLVRLGRVIGYYASYVDADAGDQLVEAVELFLTSEGAEAYVPWMVSGITGATEGVTSTPLDQGDGGFLLSSSTAAGERSWVVLREGTIVSTLVFQGPAGHGPPTDLRSLAAALGDRVQAARSTGRPYDLTHLMSATVPKADLPTTFAGLAWDPAFGGCWDRQDMVTQSDDATEVAKRIADFGVEVGCLGMYSPPLTSEILASPPPPALVRVATGITVLGSPAKADGYLASVVDGYEAAIATPKLERFEVVGVPGAQGFHRHVTDGDVREVETRVSFTRGDLVATAYVHDQAETDHVADVTAMAKALDARLQVVLGVPSS